MGGMSTKEQHEVAQEAEQHNPNHVQLEEVVEAEEPTCHSACMLQVGWQPFGRERKRRREVRRANRKEGQPGRGHSLGKDLGFGMWDGGGPKQVLESWRSGRAWVYKKETSIKDILGTLKEI